LTVSSLSRGSKAARSGLMGGDIITDIDGASVRYMPFSDAKSKISNSLFTGNLTFDIVRDLVLWRKEIRE